jgi:small basic protein
MEGIIKTMGGIPSRSSATEIFSASPFIVSVLNAMLLAAIVALAGVELGLDQTAAIGAGAIAFFAFIAVTMLMVVRTIGGIQAGYTPLFPKKPAGE